MSNVSASALPITVADLAAAKQVATDSIEGALGTREFFHVEWHSPHDDPDRIGRIVYRLNRLNEAIDGTRFVAKVEHCFTDAPGVELAGIGLEPNAHRLAIRLAVMARDAIVCGLFLAIDVQLRQSVQEAAAYRKAKRKVPKKLLAAGGKVYKMSGQLAETLRGEPEESLPNSTGRTLLAYPAYRPSLTPDELAAALLPHTWQTIQKEIGDPNEIDRQWLSARVQAEYLCACKFTESLSPLPANARAQAEREATSAAQPPPKLSSRQQNILQAAAENPKLTGEKLAEKAGYLFNADFKKELSTLVKLRCLQSNSPGYLALNLISGGPNPAPGQ
jgi:hypothetical protein